MLCLKQENEKVMKDNKYSYRRYKYITGRREITKLQKGIYELFFLNSVFCYKKVE